MATRKKPATTTAQGPTEITATTVQEVAEKLKTAFLEVSSERANRRDATEVVSELIRDLEAQKAEITMKLLGMDNKWGRWEVDHCNGRHSPITQEIDAQAKSTVRDWVNAAIKEVLTDEARSAFLKKCKAEIIKDVTNITESYETQQYAKQKIDTIRKSLIDLAAAELKSELNLIKPATKTRSEA